MPSQFPSSFASAAAGGNREEGGSSGRGSIRVDGGGTSADWLVYHFFSSRRFGLIEYPRDTVSALPAKETRTNSFLVSLSCESLHWTRDLPWHDYVRNSLHALFLTISLVQIATAFGFQKMASPLIYVLIFQVPSWS